MKFDGMMPAGIPFVAGIGNAMFHIGSGVEVLQRSDHRMGPAYFLFLVSGYPLPGLLAVLLFQMTMPITLCLLVEQMPSYPWAAFGWLTLGLFLGYLPSYFGWDAQMHQPFVYSRITFLSLMVLGSVLGMLVWQKGRNAEGMIEGN